MFCKFMAFLKSFNQKYIEYKYMKQIEIFNNKTINKIINGFHSLNCLANEGIGSQKSLYGTLLTDDLNWNQL